MTFKPTVLVAEGPKELRWLGRLLLPGMFDGEHSFRIHAGEEGVRLVRWSTGCSRLSSEALSSGRNAASPR